MKYISKMTLLLLIFSLNGCSIIDDDDFMDVLEAVSAAASEAQGIKTYKSPKTYSSRKPSSSPSVISPTNSGIRKVKSAMSCVSKTSSGKLYNGCGYEVIIPYCFPDMRITNSSRRSTCNSTVKRGTNQPYYSHQATISSGVSYKIPFSDSRRFNYVACPKYSSGKVVYARSSTNGKFSCIIK